MPSFHPAVLDTPENGSRDQPACTAADRRVLRMREPPQESRGTDEPCRWTVSDNARHYVLNVDQPDRPLSYGECMSGCRRADDRLTRRIARH